MTPVTSSNHFSEVPSPRTLDEVSIILLFSAAKNVLNITLRGVTYVRMVGKDATNVILYPNKNTNIEFRHI